MEEQTLSNSLPEPPQPAPGCAFGLLLPTAPTRILAIIRMYYQHPHPLRLSACLLPEALCCWRLVIDTVIAHTASCAGLSLTDELPGGCRLYRRPSERETFPALTASPFPGAATPAPGDHSSASAQILPWVRWPSPDQYGLGISSPTVALSIPFRELLVGQGHDAAVIPLCYGPRNRSPPGPPTSTSLPGRRDLYIRAFAL